MGRLIIISGILLSIIIIGLTSLFYLKDVNTQSNELLNDILYSCKNEDDTALKLQTDKLLALWKSKQSALKLFIKHGELDAINGMLVDLKSLYETKSYGSLYEQANRIKFSLNHLLEKETPSLGNLI